MDRFANVVLCACLPVALFSISHHETWLDELHCWRVARDSPMPSLRVAELYDSMIEEENFYIDRVARETPIEARK